MKMKNKINTLLTVIAAVLLVTSCVMGTIAYLTDSDQVINTFTVGKVSINLDETAVDTDGTPIDGADRVKENEYHMIPGKTYVKDPAVTVEKGSEASYVRMLVTLNKASEIKAIFGDEFLPENYVSGWDKQVWPCADITDNGDNTVTYEFRYFGVVDASGSDEDIVLDALFDSITVPGEITSDELATLSDFEISVVSHAIQSATFADADAAWEAFDAAAVTSGSDANN